MIELVQRSVTALQIDEHYAMSAEEFPGADLHAEVCTDMSDTDILGNMKGTYSSEQNYDDESDNADEDIQPKPTLKEARSALSVLSRGLRISLSCLSVLAQRLFNLVSRMRLYRSPTK